MLVCTVKGYALVQTDFSDKYYLIQKFRGLETGVPFFNAPIDFMGSGLMLKEKWDYFHEDIPFTITTDEATPIHINGCFIGANHGHYCTIEVYMPNHQKTLKDVGSRWMDENGVFFTIIRVIDTDWLTVISDNVGESVEKYSFVNQVTGQLCYVENGENRAPIIPQVQNRADLVSANRYRYKRVMAYVGDQAVSVRGEVECDYVELQEEYDIINPATVGTAIYANRPKDGYKTQPIYSEVGEPMYRIAWKYRVLPDGTILSFFDGQKLMDVHVERFLGVMHQEKQDVYGGGIWRYMPKTLPFVCKDGTFDYAYPIPISHDSPYPYGGAVTKEYWANPDNPCERAVDYFRDENGVDKLAFSTGFLPLFDGVPAIRKQHLTDTVMLKFTRKHYPTFMNGDLPDTIKGVGYKKYFAPQKDKASYYKVQAEGKTFIYADFFKDETLRIPISKNVTLLEQSGNVKYQVTASEIIVQCVHGYAVFVEE